MVVQVHVILMCECMVSLPPQPPGWYRATTLSPSPWTIIHTEVTNSNYFYKIRICVLAAPYRVSLIYSNKTAHPISCASFLQYTLTLTIYVQRYWAFTSLNSLTLSCRSLIITATAARFSLYSLSLSLTNDSESMRLPLLSNSGLTSCPFNNKQQAI